MGAIASYQLRQADKRMAKTLLFVRRAYAGDVAGLQQMIKKEKISPDAQDRFGMTALHWAAYGGQLLCVQALLAAGARLSVVDDNGRNALHHACRKDQSEVVRFLLLDTKMNVNGTSGSKDTPLHKAVIGKSLRCIEVLLQFGADLTMRNDQNRTPLEELDADPGIVKDMVPEPIATARMQEELAHWRQEFLTEVKQPPGKRRGSVEALLHPPAMPTMPAARTTVTTTSAPPASHSKFAENTLVTSFRMRVSEFSSARASSTGDFASSRQSSSSRPSSSSAAATTAAVAPPVPSSGQWARKSIFSSASSSGSLSGSARRDSLGGSGNGTGAVVLPLNLTGLDLPAAGGGAPETLSSSSRHHESSSSNRSIVGGTSINTSTGPGTGRGSYHQYSCTQNLRRRNLKYAGKRVIMALRVKKCLTGHEKRQMIRLLLLRHLQPPQARDPDQVRVIEENTIGSTAGSTTSSSTPTVTEGLPPDLVRGSSMFTLSLPSNI